MRNASVFIYSVKHRLVACQPSWWRYDFIWLTA